MIGLESWGWWIGESEVISHSTADVPELTPAFVSAGALSGLNASWSFLIGSILAWAVIGPLTVYTGAAMGQPVREDGSDPGWVSYSMH